MPRKRVSSPLDGTAKSSKLSPDFIFSQPETSFLTGVTSQERRSLTTCRFPETHRAGRQEAMNRHSAESSLACGAPKRVITLKFALLLIHLAILTDPLTFHFAQSAKWSNSIEHSATIDGHPL